MNETTTIKPKKDYVKKVFPQSKMTTEAYGSFTHELSRHMSVPNVYLNIPDCQ